MRHKKRSQGYAAAGAAVFSALSGFVVIFALVMLISLIMTRLDVSDKLLSVLTSGALCVGAFTGGVTAARRRRQNGLLMGLLCGLLMFAVIFVLSYIFAGAAGGMGGSGKFVMTLISASLGGVIGINSGRNFFGFK